MIVEVSPQDTVSLKIQGCIQHPMGPPPEEHNTSFIFLLVYSASSDFHC